MTNDVMTCHVWMVSQAAKKMSWTSLFDSSRAADTNDSTETSDAASEFASSQPVLQEPLFEADIPEPSFSSSSSSSTSDIGQATEDADHKPSSRRTAQVLVSACYNSDRLRMILSALWSCDPPHMCQRDLVSVFA